MPGLNGFELLSQPHHAARVVFTTAYDRYAMKAFEANGTDYLLKPIAPEALDRALSKLERNRAADPAQYRDMLDRLTAALDRQGHRYPRRIPSKLGDRVQFIDLEKSLTSSPKAN